MISSAGAAAQRLTVTFGVAALTVTGCSGPPPAQEPTGDAAERAWTMVVGDHPLDRTVAYVYSLALNSRDTPTLVESREEGPADLVEDLGEREEDEGTQILLSRTMSLAESLDPTGYEELTSQAEEAVAPAASAEDLTELISSGLTGAEMLEPAAGVLDNSMVITSITAEQHEISSGADSPEDPSFAQACDEFEVGVRQGLQNPGPLLEELYGCEPEQIVEGPESELIQSLISAEIEAAVLTTSHPQISQNALIALEDSERAFPEEQFLTVVDSEIVEEVPDVVEEISGALDDDALATLRQLIDGEDGLEPEEAAEYWLVDNDYIAEPEDWG
ncbi:glycine betaine ABC transporter substrate-binding protein [Nesterenkonia lacusekhoensis]|uniref:ABC-type glycine betaine transport system substrate-binding domain-containing protein n=1 Tax=Nesterenkonia lacusekhoensis TaxID=150832 RepID=A0ABS4SZH6_9MICC|nr:glycine betaine ABC transporter substrate-binding protein [Nesterenkonia lacusekhoensis]MBP2317611.1 hypothetical protein [Nesterenkonia lacusekhoensis]